MLIPPLPVLMIRAHRVTARDLLAQVTQGGLECSHPANLAIG